VGELLAFVVASNFNFKTFSEKRSCFSNNFKEKIAVILKKKLQRTILD
jgi:PmbA protein